MVEYPDLQGKNILEIEPKYYNNLNIDGFSKMMKSPSYCYKFYWLEAIIQLISEGKVLLLTELSELSANASKVEINMIPVYDSARRQGYEIWDYS